MVPLFNVQNTLALDLVTLTDGHDTVAKPGGAAITAAANVTITDSTISDHHTSNGGCPAIVTSAGLTIIRSTVSGNVNGASASGFAICGNDTSSMTITSSTFSGNTGGAISTSGPATILNTTIAANTATGSGNTAGIEAFGAKAVVTLENSLVTNNIPSGPSAGQCAQIVGASIVDGGGNFQAPDAFCGGTIPVADP